ncbi:MAG: hypothetical protein FJW27_04865 [Acidimicrobiia bacterium]|nr:hypothetical protein [Acidimicrobiia bacterium]
MRTGCSAWPPGPCASLCVRDLTRRSSGFSLLELLFIVGVVATVGAVAVPHLLGAAARYRTLGAARHVAATLQKARVLAVSRGANVGVRFVMDDDRFRFAMHVDANRNGLSTRDIEEGTDPQIGGRDGLEEFGGARFGLWPGLLSPDGAMTHSDDPIRVGTERLVSFTPNGTASPGSLYIRGAGGQQYVVRIYGDTGKTQVLRYASSQRLWVASP